MDNGSDFPIIVEGLLLSCEKAQRKHSGAYDWRGIIPNRLQRIIQFEGRKIRVRTWMEAKDRQMMTLESLGVATPIAES